MAQYNILNVKFSNSQLNKLKLRIENGTEVALKISRNVVGDSNDENDFPYNLLLTNTQNFCIWFLSQYKIIKNSIA